MKRSGASGRDLRLLSIRDHRLHDSRRALAGRAGTFVDAVRVLAVLDAPSGEHGLPVLLRDGDRVFDGIEIVLGASVQEPPRLAVEDFIAISRSRAAMVDTTAARRFRAGGAVALNG